MKKIVFSCLILLGLLSCTRETLKTTVTVKLPEYHGISAKGVNTQSTNQFNASLNPSAVSDINCYGIFIGGPETFMQQNNCSDATSNAIRMKFGPNRFFIPAGTETSIEVPSGPARQIYLVGLKSQGTACSLMGASQSPDFSNLSVPHILSEKTLDLQPGDVYVDMTRSIDSSKTFDTCNFISGGGGTAPANLFGNGRDGDLSVTGPAFLNFGTDSYSADPDAAQTAAVNSPINTTKKISTSRRVTHIDNATGTVLTLDSGVMNFDLESGDEVLWYVSSAWGSPNPDDQGCGAGSSLFRGRYGFANIVSVSTGQTLVLDKPITPTPGSINNTNVGQASASPGVPFCRIHVSRVPNFNTINIAATQSLSFTVSNFTSLNGGIIAFKANEIIINSGASLNVSTDGKGFASATSSQGNGVEGVGNVTVAASNMNGGGSADSGGGGGGSADGGDSGGTTPGLKGMGVKFCLGATPCLPARDQKMFFGGGGGGAGAGAGGTGGGIILIHAKKISGSGAMILSSKGVTGSSGTGGGGGGTVSLTVKEIPSTITTSILANGGNGTSGTYTGGGGGGGVTEVKYCGALSNVTNVTATATGGTGFTSGGTAPANAQEILAVPSLCN